MSEPDTTNYFDIEEDGTLSIEMEDFDTMGNPMYCICHTLSIEEVIELRDKCEKVIRKHEK